MPQRSQTGRPYWYSIRSIPWMMSCGSIYARRSPARFRSRPSRARVWRGCGTFWRSASVLWASESEGMTKHRVFRPTFRGLRVEEVGEGVYEVSGGNVERLALRTDWDSTEGVANFQRELEKKGVVAALKKAGAEPGDEIRIGEVEFEYQ